MRSSGPGFGPVVLLGLASGGLTAVAGNRPWARVAGADPVGRAVLDFTGTGQMPAAGALGLVLLACWGVLLVTRGRVRRAVAVVALAAAAGAVVAAGLGWSSTVEELRAGLAASGSTAGVARTGWAWAAATGAGLSVVASLLAVRLAPSWPEMGRRYDAPQAATAEPTPDEERSSLDLWRAMDEGQDPTA